GFLVGIVIMRETDIGQRPSALDHPFLDVLAVDLAARDLPAAAVGLDDMAAPALAADMLDEFVARGDAAGPALAAVVEAELIHRRRVDPAQSDSAVADDDLVAFADFGNAGDVGRIGDGRQKQ